MKGMGPLVYTWGGGGRGGEEGGRRVFRWWGVGVGQVPNQPHLWDFWLQVIPSGHSDSCCWSHNGRNYSPWLSWYSEWMAAGSLYEVQPHPHSSPNSTYVHPHPQEHTNTNTGTHTHTRTHTYRHTYTHRQAHTYRCTQASTAHLQYLLPLVT